MTEYSHGKRVSLETWEMSPLELSIYQYEQRCKNYYYKTRKKPNETDEERSARLDELAIAKQHLKVELKKILAMAQVQEGLRKYRTEFDHYDDDQRDEAFETEGHHPTDVLEDNLRMAGRAQPSPRYTAHHIVQGKGKLPITALARAIMFENNVRINDSDNGVWMPMTEEDRGHWAMPKTVPHSRIHTHNYERWVYGVLEGALSEVEVRAKLLHVRLMLKHGTQPEKVLKKPDAKWNGRA